MQAPTRLALPVMSATLWVFMLYFFVVISFENLERHQQLTRLIAEEIRHSVDQRISFARFMELALLAPSLGYYQASSNVLGSQGDFTTAPEISSLWSVCLARYCAPILKAVSPQCATVLEIGAGTGRMAADMLLAFERLGCLPDRYILVEVSETLRKVQQANLKQWVPHLISRIEHRASLPSQPVEGVILANEVIDALPCHRFVLSDGVMHEHYVAYHNHQFVWEKGKVSDVLEQPLRAIHAEYLQGVNDYCSEIRASLRDWWVPLQACLKRGCMLLIDYGRSAKEYYHPLREKGTLRCYYQHQVHDNPLEGVGLRDITSDVDFTQVALLASQEGLTVHAFVSQAAFLLLNGLLAQEKSCYDQALYLKLKGQIHQLTSPLEMGELCKVMVLSRDFSCDLLSLDEYDKRFSL
jgi:SAM-dependent MidA family methyltransferase